MKNSYDIIILLHIGDSRLQPERPNDKIFDIKLSLSGSWQEKKQLENVIRGCYNFFDIESS